MWISSVSLLCSTRTRCKGFPSSSRPRTTRPRGVLPTNEVQRTLRRSGLARVLLHASGMLVSFADGASLNARLLAEELGADPHAVLDRRRSDATRAAVPTPESSPPAPVAVREMPWVHVPVDRGPARERPRHRHRDAAAAQDSARAVARSTKVPQ